MKWTYAKTGRSSARLELNARGGYGDCYILIDGNKKDGYECASYPRVFKDREWYFEVQADSLKDAAETAVLVWKDFFRVVAEEYLNATIIED